MARRKKLWIGVAALVASLSAGAGALALSAQNGPRTEAVSGTFTASPVNVKQRVCVGDDGPYVELRGKWEGAITGSDPRLNGRLQFMAEPALINAATGLGTFQGRFSIDQDGRQTVQGHFFTVVTEGSLNHGFAVAKVMDQGPGLAGAEDFFASFKSTVSPTLVVTGEFGGTADQRTPAVIQRGPCNGPFVPVP